MTILEILIEQEAIPATGHSYSNATCTTAATCTACGVTTGSALGHNYVNGTCGLLKCVKKMKKKRKNILF